MNRQQTIGRIAGRVIFLTAAIAVFGFSQTVFGQCVSLTGAAYAENFTGNLFAPGTTPSTNIPTGWSFAETGTGANTTLADDVGATATANTYAYGGTSRAASFGEVTGNGFLSRFGACFTNNTGFTVRTLTIGYTGEQWRSGGPAGPAVVDRLDFQYVSDIQSVGNDTAGWRDINNLDFVSLINNEAAGAINRARLDDDVILSPRPIIGLNIPNGSSFTIRWVGFDRPGVPDHGLAVDSFSLSTSAATAALLTIGGRVTTANNRGVANAFITLTDPEGASRIIQTNPFGYYRFGNVAAGLTYILNVRSKQYRFKNSSAVFTAAQSLENLDFTAFR